MLVETIKRKLKLKISLRWVKKETLKWFIRKWLHLHQFFKKLWTFRNWAQKGEEECSATLCEKCPYMEFFWCVFYCIRTRKTPHLGTFHAVQFINSFRGFFRIYLLILILICSSIDTYYTLLTHFRPTILLYTPEVFKCFQRSEMG